MWTAASATMITGTIYFSETQNWLQYVTHINAIPVQAWTGPLGSRRLRLLEFLDNWHMKVVMLSAQCIGCLYLHHEISLVLISVRG